MVRHAVRKSAAAAILVSALALVAPPPAAALPWVDTAVGQASRVVSLFDAWWGLLSKSLRTGDDSAQLDPDGHS